MRAAQGGSIFLVKQLPVELAVAEKTSASSVLSAELLCDAVAN